MGCGASTAAVEVPQGRPVVHGKLGGAAGAFAEPGGLRAVREEGRRDQSDDNLSLASSACTIGSLPSNRTSLLSARLHHRRGSNDDLLSEVPTITESVADMQELSDMLSYKSGRCPCGGMSSSCVHCAANIVMRDSPHKSSEHGGGMSAGFTLVDNRPHPLAPVSFYSDAESLQTNPGTMDMGYDDVASVRDDNSIVSAASDICVTIIGGHSPSASERGRSTTPTSSSSRLKYQGGGRADKHERRGSTGTTGQPSNGRGGLASKARQLSKGGAARAKSVHMEEAAGAPGSRGAPAALAALPSARGLAAEGRRW